MVRPVDLDGGEVVHGGLEVRPEARGRAGERERRLSRVGRRHLSRCSGQKRAPLGRGGER